MAGESRIATCIWFDDKADEAAKFYTSLFRNSRINATSHYADGMSMPKGTVLTVDFELDGQRFLALNGGPIFRPNEAMSVVAYCDDQAEVDRLWETLGKGGEHGPCGWLKDKYGVSWQITPRLMIELTLDPNEARRARVMAAMMKMGKLDIAALRRAYEDKAA
jgi:predicted 3-demethylubiquinone-9 3-methyltransferase (glyoxalase superfamily)